MITQWAARHGIPSQALAELRALLVGTDNFAVPALVEGNEASIQALVRVKASQAGWRLWRNNLGAGKLENGSFLRWGLANDSPAMNSLIKSADLIGIKPGGQFVSREVKRPGWHYTDTERERAQLRWIEVINGLGGNAKFTTGEL